jgi:ureidoglycolate lyase
MQQILIAPLTEAAFARYGDVVEADGAEKISINQGFAVRVNRLARVDVASSGGEVNISLFTAKARPLPTTIAMMERHPLGSQLFYPLQDASWLVVVCFDPHDIASFRAFKATGRQGVNYARNVWHHPLLVRSDNERFLVVDRSGPGNNLEEFWLDEPHVLQFAPESSIA